MMMIGPSVFQIFLIFILLIILGLGAYFSFSAAAIPVVPEQRITVPKSLIIEQPKAPVHQVLLA